MAYLSNGYFDVALAGVVGAIAGRFTSVSGLGMEVEYEVFNEGGLNYPRFYFKETKPVTLVLEQGVVTDVDAASILMMSTNKGISIPLAGGIVLYDTYGNPQREWSIVGAYLKKYDGPTLDANNPQLAVNRIELIHNGCY